MPNKPMDHAFVSERLSPSFPLVVGRPAEWKMCASFHIATYVYNDFGESIERQNNLSDYSLQPLCQAEGRDKGGWISAFYSCPID